LILEEVWGPGDFLKKIRKMGIPAHEKPGGEKSFRFIWLYKKVVRVAGIELRRQVEGEKIAERGEKNIRDRSAVNPPQRVNRGYKIGRP